MPPTQVYLQEARAPDLFEALKTLIKGLAGLRLCDEFPGPEVPCVGLIPWFSLRPGAFISDLSQLWETGCRQFVLVGPTRTTLPPWNSQIDRFPPHLRTAFDAAIAVCMEPSLEKLKNAIAEAENAPPWATRRVQDFVECFHVYESLRSFSHGSRADVTNQFLAPARLMLTTGDPLRNIPDSWKKVWEEFRDKVLKQLQPRDDRKPGDAKTVGLVGQELARAGRNITDSFAKGFPPSVPDLESVMALLTNVREITGIRSHVSGGRHSYMDGGTAIEPITASGLNAFRVLVVDDHAASWEIVFRRLQQKLTGEPGLASGICFEFSLDGKTVQRTATSAPEQIKYSFYDLVILDILLGGRTGIEILEQLRRDFSQLPVLLWTTSRDEELVTKATLANGILLKKTVSWESLTEVIARSVTRGKAMRTASLPNPFFNHAIQNLEYRQLAVDFHEWCLKQLDSFHALDNSYFRYFTDHGGRHVVKLLELLEQALQPFLQDEDGTVLPNDPNDRELEILGLYLTVVCHELGMFPMRIGGKVEDFGSLKFDYLNGVRTIHAARGMVLLRDSTEVDGGIGIGEYWNDDEGRGLGRMLHNHPALRDRIAVLVGYHARLFKSLSNAAFLTWRTDDNRQRGAKYDLDNKLSRLPSSVPECFRASEVFMAAFNALSDSFKLDRKRRERLRCQCSLVRFVDALDVTRSRNSAEFLLESGTPPREEYSEKLKRALCVESCIRNGDVSVRMVAQAPSVSSVQKILEYVAKDEELKEQVDQVRVEKARGLVKDKATALRLLEYPWSPPGSDGRWAISAIQDNSVVCLLMPLDCWLSKVWSVLMPDENSSGRDDAFIEHLKTLHVVLDSNRRLDLEGAESIASLTALSVAGELLDEYQAIVEAGLDHQIRLGKFGFGGAWMKEILPKGLGILRRFLSSPETKAPLNNIA